MAKISAGGAAEVARESFDITDGGLGAIRFTYVLCSDDRILKAISLPQSTDPLMRRLEYKLDMRIPSCFKGDRVAAFRHLVQRRKDARS